MEDISVVEQGRRPPGIGFTLYSDGVLHTTLDHGSLLDIANARAVRAVLHELGGPFVVVADLRGVAFVDRDARAYLANDQGIVLATAVVTGRDGPIPFLVERWLTDNTITRPVVKFEGAEEALVWAHDAAAQFRTQGHLP